MKAHFMSYYIILLLLELKIGGVFMICRFFLNRTGRHLNLTLSIMRLRTIMMAITQSYLTQDLTYSHQTPTYLTLANVSGAEFLKNQKKQRATANSFKTVHEHYYLTID